MFDKIRFKFFITKSWEFGTNVLRFEFDLYSWMFGAAVIYPGCVRVQFGPIMFDIDTHPLPF